MNPSRPLRVSILGLNYSPEPTGIAPYTTRLAERLVAEGHHVRVLTGFPHYPEWKVQDGYTGWTKYEIINGVHITRLRHTVPRKVTTLTRLHLEISFGLRLLFAAWHRPDVVLLVSPALFSSAVALLRIRFGFRRPAVGVWVQDLYTRGVTELGRGTTISAKLIHRLESSVLASGSKVAVIHDRFREYVTSALGVRENDVRVIRNWVHIDPPQAFDRNSVRSRWGWKSTDTVVLHAGNMGAKQSLENVVATARLADKHHSKVVFVLLGDGNQRPRIERLAEGVERIQFLDPLPDGDFERTLASADILLVNEMTGLREMAVPSKLTSYFSTGLPVVAATEADSTTASEIAEARGGVRVNPDHPEDLLHAVEELGNNPELARTLGEAGMHYARTTLSEETAILQYTAWLQDLVASK